MREIIRWLGIAIVMVVLTACGGGGSSGSTISSSVPESAKLISVSSADKGVAYIEWLPSADESLGDIFYEVHLSTQKDFVPTSTTKKLETTEKEAEVTGLTPGETYYVIIRTKHEDLYTTSLPLSVKIASTEAKFADGTQVIVHESNQIVAADNTTVTSTKEMKAGDYVVGDAEHIYLRKVISVDNVGGNYVAQTEKASLGEVYASLEFSTSYKLEDTNTLPQATATVTQNKYKSSYVWNSGSKLSSEYFIDKSKSIASLKQTKVIAGDDNETDSNDYYKISIPTVFSANTGDNLSYPFSITQLSSYSTYASLSFNEQDECEAVGGTHEEDTGIDNCLNIPVKICSATYTTTDVDDSGSNNLPKVVKRAENDYAIEWIPNSNNINKEYLLDVDFKIGIGDCTGDNEDRLGTISLEDIKLISGDELPSQVSFAKDEHVDFSMGDDRLNNTLTATFSPEIIFDGRFIDSDLEEANAKLHVDFGISDIANLHLETDAEHTFTPKPIYTKRFTKIVMAGVVPIVLTGQLKLMAVATVESSASVDATLDTGMNFTLDYGLHYNGEAWEPIKDAKSTYHVKLEAEGHTETTMTVTLIPDFNIEVYELAAAHLLAEPYFYATVGVEGKVTAQAASDDNTYTDINAQFEKLEAGAGMDLKVYAGAAWKTKLKSLRFPEEATYASITDSAFMASSGLMDYYGDTRKYKNFEVFAKTPIASIPTLTKENPYYSELPPSGVDSRAIKVKVGYENIENPLYSIKIGSQYIITFDSWDTPLSVTDNAQIISSESEGEYWVVPQLNADGSLYDTQVRFVGHSTLGQWARQTIDVSLEVATDAGELPSYWMGRYGISDPSGDKDADYYSNLLEYQNGTNPDDSSSHPAGEPDIVEETDTTPPVITITGDNPATVTKGGTYNDAGATAIDDVDGDVSVTIVSNDVDTSTVGTYHVVYSAKDSAGNEANATREVKVEETDTTPPVITITGDNPVTILKDETYNDAGATATDDVDGDVGVTIVSNDVDTSTVGTYHVVYSAKDSAGNEVNATREVKVEEAENKVPTAVAKVDPTTAIQGEIVTFDASDSNDSDGEIVSYEWKEGDVVLSTEKSFSEDNLSVGDHTITLTVRDDDDANASDSVMVTINSSESTGEVKKTGQTTSYDTSGNEVTDGSLKDDGYYQKGVDPDYTRDDEKEVVIDNITGLMWQDDADAKNVTKQWLTDENYDICDDNNSAPECYDTSGDTAATYCENLALGGYSDWRLPTSKELEGIVDYGKFNPSIDTTYFYNVSSSNYWSSTTVEYDHEAAWSVGFSYGYVDYYNAKGNNLYIRCVKDGE